MSHRYTPNHEDRIGEAERQPLAFTVVQPKASPSRVFFWSRTAQNQLTRVHYHLINMIIIRRRSAKSSVSKAGDKMFSNLRGFCLWAFRSERIPRRRGFEQNGSYSGCGVALRGGESSGGPRHFRHHGGIAQDVPQEILQFAFGSGPHCASSFQEVLCDFAEIEKMRSPTYGPAPGNGLKRVMPSNLRKNFRQERQCRKPHKPFEVHPACQGYRQLSRAFSPRERSAQSNPMLRARPAISAPRPIFLGAITTSRFGNNVRNRRWMPSTIGSSPSCVLPATHTGLPDSSPMSAPIEIVSRSIPPRYGRLEFQVSSREHSTGRSTQRDITHPVNFGLGKDEVQAFEH